MISQDSSSPLFVVVGSTGVQGRSVIKALEESSRSYRIRAITRDTARPAAQALERIGCRIVQADVDDVESLKTAFANATYAFLMTTSDYTDYSPDFDHEYSQGKNQFDAAVQANVQVIAWAGITSMKDLYDGKGKVDNYDVKARVTAYGRSLRLPSGHPPRILDVQPGAYVTNYVVANPPRPASDDPNTFTFSLTLPPDAALPVIDMEEDYGKYVVGPLEWALDGGAERWEQVKTVRAAPAYITPSEMAQAFQQGKSIVFIPAMCRTYLATTAVSGKTVTYHTTPDDQLYAILKGMAGDRAAGCLVEMYKGIRDVGYYGGDDLAPSNAHLPRPARTFVQALEGRAAAVQKIFNSEA